MRRSRYLSVDGLVDSTLGKVDGAALLAGGPVRSFPTYKGQRNYPGLLWTATTGTLVGYESLLGVEINGTAPPSR